MKTDISYWLILKKKIFLKILYFFLKSQKREILILLS